MRLSSYVLAGALALSGLAGFSGSASALVVDIQADAEGTVRAINSPPTASPGTLSTATSVSVPSGWGGLVSTPPVTDFTISTPITLLVGSTVVVTFDIGADAYTDTLTIATDTVVGNTVELTSFGELMGPGAGTNVAELDLTFNQAGGSGKKISGSATFSASSVPEPSTWAMMALGFIGLGYTAFRRSAKNRMFAAA